MFAAATRPLLVLTPAVQPSQQRHTLEPKCCDRLERPLQRLQPDLLIGIRFSGSHLLRCLLVLILTLRHGRSSMIKRAGATTR